ncbi:MAG TPA: hypothetical protein VGO93_01505 [Candidatus Xenobia bacterium]|jgi:type II secretory pathway pseudopilin PulG
MDRQGNSLLELIVAMALSAVVFTLMVAYLVPTLRASTKGQVRAEMQQQAMLALGRIADDLQRSSPGGVSLNDSEFSALIPKTVAPGCPPPTAPPQSTPVVLAIQRVNYEDTNGNTEWQPFVQVYAWNPVPKAPFPLTGSTMQMAGGVSVQLGNLITFQSRSGVRFPCGSVCCFADAPTKLSDATLVGMVSSPPASPTILANNVSYFVVAVSNVVKTNGAGPCCPPLPIINSPITLFIQLVRQGNTGARSPEFQNFSKTVSLRNTD